MNRDGERETQRQKHKDHIVKRKHKRMKDDIIAHCFHHIRKTNIVCYLVMNGGWAVNVSSVTVFPQTSHGDSA